MPAEAGDAALQLLVRGDLPVQVGAEVYALHPANLRALTVRLLTAADLAAALDLAG